MSVEREASGQTLTRRHATTAERARRAPATSRAARIALVVGSVLFSLAALEVGCRLLRFGPEGLVHWPNIARQKMSNSEDGSGSCAYAYDAELGWTTPPGCASSGYNVDADGFRLTPAASLPGAPAASPLAEPPILATGSSFAKGDEVADDETWPAYLQTLTGRRVVNAGVSGYALDQAVLATERLARRVKPLVVVLSFTPGDIRRTELEVAWSREKPYFTVTGDGLALRNVPVPGRPHAPVPLPPAARLLGWSALADAVVKRLGLPDGWYYDEVRATPPGTGETIACRLMPRLATLGVPVVVLAQYGRGTWWADPEGRMREVHAVRRVLGCAADAGLIPFDLSGPLHAVVATRGLDALYRSDHHSAAGNRLVAELLEKELARRHLLTLPSGN